MKKIWKSTHDKNYIVSNYGEVMSFRRYKEGRILKNIKLKIGYEQVCFGVASPHYIHRLVAKAFIPNPLNLPMVHHKDGDKANNHQSNLEWVTNQENIQNAYDSGAMKPNRKITDEQVALIKKEYFEDGLSQYKLGAKYSVSRSTIQGILNGRRYCNLNLGGN
jgi:hypothetical protein